jgi:cytochrome c oxidase cbb3-type subunit I
MPELITREVFWISMAMITTVAGLLALFLFRIAALHSAFKRRKQPDLRSIIYRMDAKTASALLSNRKAKAPALRKVMGSVLSLLLLPISSASAATGSPNLLEQPGILITLVLISIPLVAGIVLMSFKILAHLKLLRIKQLDAEATELATALKTMDDHELDRQLRLRKTALNFQLDGNELSGYHVPSDTRGLITQIHSASSLTAPATARYVVPAQLRRLILSYLGTAIVWLIFGTTVGEYLGIKFLSPEIDQQSWLSFGRLRPVHTNAVFWGWCSLAMLGLGHYVIPRVSGGKLYSYRYGWAALILINLCVVLGTICLMAGINNGGGEYREYVWPVMALFGAGLAITLINFYRTIALRPSREIYISSWYIVSAIMFTLVIAIIAYWPTWQNGLGETIVQGYYMHQGVGMWFMLFTLGLVYYFLPVQLNQPVYSYGLGILAFWSQILFYTVIGTHHFVFSSIPWWLQTVAIVGSAGMLIPVTAGTINFYMTFKGNWNKVIRSSTLPFFVAGILFYFTGSYQGTAEAFRFTNLLWHFTDFTVAHSHLTMYGIIAFILWGCIYYLVPRLTGNHASAGMMATHFWMALIGLMLYTIPLMIGGTLKGLMWMDGKPFMDSVTAMIPFWTWRAIGGTLMWLSHLIFAFNFYRMVIPATASVEQRAFQQIQTSLN